MNAEGLEAFVDEGGRRSKAKGYHPNEFERMRARWTTKEAIRRLVVSGEIQSGFKRMKEVDLLDWSLEAAVLKFPGEFNREAREAAQWRLERAHGTPGQARA